jgi:hypothetical protein
MPKGILRFADKVTKTQFAEITTGDYPLYLTDYSTWKNPTSAIKCEIKNFDSDGGVQDLIKQLLGVGIDVVLVHDEDWGDLYLVGNRYEADGNDNPTDDQLLKDADVDGSPYFRAYVVSPELDVSEYPTTWSLPKKYLNDYIKEFRAEQKRYAETAKKSSGKAEDLIKQIKNLQKELAKYGS